MNPGRPVIGIAARHNEDVPGWRTVQDSDREAYFSAVAAGGGTPLLIAGDDGEAGVLAAYAGIDGLLLPGGPDLAPAEYGERLRRGHHVHVDIEQDWIELLLTRRALTDGMAILGICRGIQLLNVAAGGTLFQDIQKQVPGAPDHRANGDLGTHLRHFVKVVPGTRLERVAGSTPLHVNTRHHQAVKDVAPGFVVSGWSDDGVIEAMERPASRFILAVQWHPEHLWPSDPRAHALFTAFVAAARNRNS